MPGTVVRVFHFRFSSSRLGAETIGPSPGHARFTQLATKACFITAGWCPQKVQPIQTSLGELQDGIGSETPWLMG